jgi:RNA polymerase primary sigma factor
VARLASITHPALSELEQQLRHAPRESLLRDVERIEELAQDVDTALEYPLEWVVFRITGYRPTESTAPVLVPGTALLNDLAAIAERLCVRARLTLAELPPGSFEPAREVAARWGASPATLKRWRRAGLVTRRVLVGADWGERGKLEVYVSHEVAQAFRTRHALSVNRAQRMTRVDAHLRARMLREAMRYRRVLGFSLHQTAQRLAERHGRSVEGVRHLLQTAPELENGTSPVFPRKRRIDERRRRALLRLWQRGWEPSALGTMIDRPAILVRREVSLARLHVLREMVPSTVPSTLPSAVEFTRSADLAHPAVTRELAIPWEVDLADILRLWRTRVPEPREAEHARASAYHTLCAQAVSIVRVIDHLHPSPAALDEAETALRWASLLVRTLVRTQHRLILDTIETRAGHTLTSVPAPVLVRTVRACVRAAARAVDSFDPGRGGRLAGPVAIAVDRAVTASLRSLPVPTTKRAAPLLEGTVEVRCLTPWDRWLLPDPRIVRSVRTGAVDAADAALLSARFGLAGSPPRTLTSFRDQEPTSAIRLAMRVQRALGQAWTAGNTPARTMQKQ